MCCVGYSSLAFGLLFRDVSFWLVSDVLFRDVLLWGGLLLVVSCATLLRSYSAVIFAMCCLVIVGGSLLVVSCATVLRSYSAVRWSAAQSHQSVES